MTNKNKITQKLEKYISEYDVIFVVEKRYFLNKTFLQNISQYTTKKCLLLVVGTEKEGIAKCGIDIQEISYEEYCDIEKLYYLYEFSDQIHILNDNTQYGNLDNYIDNGLLTREEALMASSIIQIN